jgi:hypothetical protein
VRKAAVADEIAALYAATQTGCPADLATVQGEMIDASTMADIGRGLKAYAEWAPS